MNVAAGRAVYKPGTVSKRRSDDEEDTAGLLAALALVLAALTNVGT